MIIDSHLHLWDRTRTDYAWIPPGPLDRTFTLADARAELDPVGIDAAILVQAEDSVADTRAMIEAAANPFVAGVVGWVELDDPEVAEEQLADYGDRLCGVRHLVHDDPRDDFLELSSVQVSLGLLAANNLALDIPDAWPRHLARVPSLADRHPDLTIVIDHLGKPPRGTDLMGAWQEGLREISERPNTMAKVSGLQVAGLPFTRDEIRPVWDIALGLFGPERLAYGGDWPMTLPDGGYQPHWQVIKSLIDDLSPAERARVLAGTAIEAYGLPTPTEGS